MRGGGRDWTCIAEALGDLHEDLAQLLHVCRGADAKLAAFELELPAAAPHPASRELLARQTLAARRRYRVLERRLLALREVVAVDELAAAKAAIADLLRTEQALTAALLCAADWQSPTFGHAGLPAAGRQAGSVRAHFDDYKRDRHPDADAYERAYVRAYVDHPAGLELRALLTSCGMAALTTVLAALELDGPVLAGAGLYHESKLLLARAVPDVRYVDEAELPAAVAAARPAAVFVDSPVRPTSAALGDAWLVVDRTALSVTCQPFALVPSERVIVFESLLKYAQLGMDRANAGVIVAAAGVAARLDGYREHLGTNISDTAVHALPPPDRVVLERRLARIWRNAAILAERLQERGRTPFLHGGTLSLGADPALVDAAVAAARRRGVELHAGSSFGFDTTRIYLTAATAEFGEPFVRVAAGTEHRLEIEAVADALCEAVAP